MTLNFTYKETKNIIASNFRLFETKYFRMFKNNGDIQDDNRVAWFALYIKNLVQLKFLLKFLRMHSFQRDAFSEQQIRIKFAVCETLTFQ